MKPNKKFTADFETATWLENETFVWAWATCEIGNEENIKIGTTIDSFIDYALLQSNATFYFHNAKFDSEFIIYWAFKNGFRHVTDKKDIEDKTFTTLINNMGQFYSMTLYFEKGNKRVKKITIIDSLKIIPISVEKIPEAFNIKEKKLDLDYYKERKEGQELTTEEKEYIKHDVIIVAKALKMLFDEGLNKMTVGANALSYYKETIGKINFRKFFPLLDKEVDADIRKSYRGGFTYLNPIYREKDVENIVNLDVNSLYPYCLRYKKLPFGVPIFFEGKYEKDVIYNLYIQKITCSFKIKKNKIPTIQLKNTLGFRENEYIETTNGEIVTLFLTNIDLDLFLEHYDVEDLDFECGWKFKSMGGFFNDYIDKWMEVKKEATITKNKGLRTISKLMLNSLYGKYATKLKVTSKIPFMGDDDVIHYYEGEPVEKDGIYIPVATFTTAYAREITIRTSQKIKEYSIEKYGKDMYIYSDTDSIKTLLPIEELKDICNIDDIELRCMEK